MKCPKCHKEVEKGSLYCPYCLAEIPWVREFSTVETLMKKEQQNRPSEKKQKTEKKLLWVLNCLMHLYIFEKIKNTAPLKQNEKKHALIYPDLKPLPVEHYSVEPNKKKQ